MAFLKEQTMKLNLSKLLKTVGTVAGILLPVAPVIIAAGKEVIKTKGKSAPDTIVTGVEIARTLGAHDDRIDALEKLIQGAQAMGALPHTSAISTANQ